MLKKILELLESGNVFLTGSAGTGKSFLTREIIDDYFLREKFVVVLGSTGISAINIGGVTIHSFFKFKQAANLNELRAIDKKQKEQLGELSLIIANTDLIVIDEVSMMSADLLEMISLRLKTMNYRGRILLVGDFYQLAPVIKKTEKTLFSREFAFESDAWRELELKAVLLTRQKRTKNAEFFGILSQIRNYEFTSGIYDFLHSRCVKSVDLQTTMLFGRNDGVNEMNEKRLAELDAPLREFRADLSAPFDDSLQNEINSWVRNIGLKSNLELKIGAKVMFSTNKIGSFYNGERGSVVDFSENSVIVEKDSGMQIEVEPVKYEFFSYEGTGDDVEQNVLATFTQIPLKLAYAITIHKSQGMSLNNFTCDLNHLFAPGHLYVALSRAIDPNGLFLRYTNKLSLERYLSAFKNKNMTQINSVSDFYAKSEFIKEQ